MYGFKDKKQKVLVSKIDDISKLVIQYSYIPASRAIITSIAILSKSDCKKLFGI